MVRKLWNCTFVWSPDTHLGSSINLGPSHNAHTIPSGHAHELYNNISAIIDTQRYPYAEVDNDIISFGIGCKYPDAGCYRLDYNCYWKDVPSPNQGFCSNWVDSRNTNAEAFATLAAFRSSGKKTLSEAMYSSIVGAFSSSNGTDGHEEHGVQVDPGFVDIANRDYRPAHPSVTSGHLDVSSSGWPDATAPHSWKGALDPNGNGTEVGPQNE